MVFFLFKATARSSDQAFEHRQELGAVSVEMRGATEDYALAIVPPFAERLHATCSCYVRKRIPTPGA